ncbi:MAG TPA: ATP-binding protein [Anaerolineales bacterium]|nr:ATP-binding protein [Anaerolineales bacterium]
MKLTTRLTLVFILYALALLSGVGLLAYDSGRDSLREATISELQATALEKEAALTSWAEEKQIDIATMAANPTNLRAASLLLNAAPHSEEAREARETLIANILPRVNNGEFVDVNMLHPETGQVLASTNPAEEGKFRENRLYFLNGKTGPFIQDMYYSLALQSLAMTASAPLRAANGELLGVLTAHLDLEEMNEILKRRTAQHQTDDAYLVNTSSLFVTQPRFILDPAVLQLGVHTEDVRRCLQRQSGTVETRDYRDVPVIAVYQWLPERDLCLVAKLDQTEAYGPARAFGGTIALTSTVALLAAAMLAIGLSRTVTEPILALRAGAARFGQGNLDTRLPETSRDELGDLAREFNRMAEALAEQQTHLRRRAEQFFNITLDLLCTVSLDGHLIDLNPAWEQTLGYDRQMLKNRPLTELVYPDDIASTASALRRVADGMASIRFEARFRDRDGSYHWLAWAVVISPQDELLYGAARDVTQRRLAEEQLQQQADELERSNRELEQFAYVASHDLQEPLRIVSSYVQLLARRYKGKLDQDADEFINYAVEGANRMKTLINDLLAYSRVGTRGKELVPVEMEEVFERVSRNLKIALQESGAALTHDALPVVLADDLQMTQLLQNLLGNAIKFRGARPPRVHFGVRRQEEHWLFFVRDNGIGIDPQYRERIFVIFQRLHNRSEYPGTGIGLAICRKIVERHGGQIWVESVAGEGATFYFTLQPAEHLPPETPQPETTTPRTRDTIADRATDLI